MSTYRERREARAERRREWAKGRRTESDRRTTAASEAARSIPLGQPILVGHHSEKRDRAFRERIGRNFEKAHEADQMAMKHVAAADEIERQLDLSVYDDDPDAIERLEERIAARETARDRAKDLNRVIRREWKKGAEGFAGRLRDAGATDSELSAVARNLSVWRSPIFPSYHLTNLGANIRRDRERIKVIQARRAKAERAESTESGVLIERFTGSYDGHEYARVTFAAKPGREVIDALKAAGFYWGKGSWHGQASRLPEFDR
jgi:hypothetical protein